MILFIVKQIFVPVCKYYSSHFQIMRRAFQLTLVCLLLFMSSVKKKMCLEQNRCKIRFHAVIWSCITNDTMQKYSASPFLGQIYEFTYSYWAIIQWSFIQTKHHLKMVFFYGAYVSQEHLEGHCTWIFLCPSN